MGDKILMKTAPLIILSICIQLTANELSWVDEQIQAIKPPRKGVSQKEISLLKDPFIFLEKTEEEEKGTKTTTGKKPKKTVYKRIKKHHSVKLVLEAIMNKSALINGKWYKEGQKVYGYLLKKVNTKSIVLTKGKKQLTLSTLSKNTHLKFKNN